MAVNLQECLELVIAHRWQDVGVRSEVMWRISGTGAQHIPGIEDFSALRTRVQKFQTIPVSCSAIRLPLGADVMVRAADGTPSLHFGRYNAIDAL